MNKNPTVSVIIPTYNRAHLVGRAIQSVLNQTYQDFELIVVDDGSKDSTEKVIKEFQQKDNRIIYLKHDQNKGGSAARNTGIKASRGEYIAFLDSDDLWLPEKLKVEINILENGKKFIICSTGYNFIDQRNNKIIGYSKIKRKVISQKNVLNANCITTNDFTAIKEKVIEIGGFDEKLPARQDWDFWIRITSLGMGYQDSLNLVNKYTMRDDQISSGIKNKLNGTEAILKRHKKLFLSDPIAYGAILRNIGLMHILNNDQVKTIEYYWKAYKVITNLSTKCKILSIIIIVKIFGNAGLTLLTYMFKLKNPNSYLLW